MEFLFVRLFICLCLQFCVSVTKNKTATNQNGYIKRLPDITSLCPNNRFCESSPSEVVNTEGTESCCEACSCKPDCHEIGSCCPDAPVADYTNIKYPCQHVFELSKHVPGLSYNTNANKVLRFHIITECADKSKDLAFIKCSQPATNIEDFVIVSDPRSGKVYRNKHCAECNGIQDYETWKIDVICLGIRSFFHIDTFEEMEQAWQNNCSVMSYPPNEKAGRMSHCNQDIISECNVTGRWDIFDAELLNACMKSRESQNVDFRSIDPHSFNEQYFYYSSVYCYLCNEPDSVDLTDKCKVVDPYSITKGTSFVRIFGEISHMNEQDSAHVQEYKCKSSDIWDPFSEACRPLFCPSREKPINGRCVGLFSKIEGLAFSINFELNFLKGHIPDVSRYLISIMENIILRLLGENLKCGKCFTKVYQRMNDTASIFLEFGIYTTETCSDDVIFKKIRKIAGENKVYRKIRYNGQEFKFEIKIIFENFNDDKIFQGSWYKKHKICALWTHIDSTVFLQCAHIVIPKEEADALDIFTSSLLQNNTGVDAMPVCLDTYMSRRTSKSGACCCFCRGFLSHLHTSLMCSVITSIILKKTI